MLEIIKAEEKEIEVIIKLGRQTFYETFYQVNSAEDMNHYLDTAFSFEKIQEEINNVNSLFFIAYEDKIPAGYLKVNFDKFPAIIEQTEEQAIDFNIDLFKQQKVMELQRIYILEEFIGKKIGKILMEKSVKIANENNIDYIWLGVAEDNHRAREFYDKWGFKTFASHIFQTGTNVEKDLLMQLSLKP